MKVNRRLSVQPEFGGCPERRTEPQSHLRRHRGSTIHKPINDFDITTEVVGKLFLCHTERNQEFLFENLPGAGGSALPSFAIHDSSLNDDLEGGHSTTLGASFRFGAPPQRREELLCQGVDVRVLTHGTLPD